MWLVGQFCERIGRDHKSNGVKMTVDLSARVVYQTCWCVRATHSSVTLQYPHTDGLRSLCCFVVVVVNFTFIILLVCLPACASACLPVLRSFVGAGTLTAAAINHQQSRSLPRR